MGFFDNVFRSGDAKKDTVTPPKQSVTIFMKGTGLPDQVYINYDLATLEEKLDALIQTQSLGELDGNVMSAEGAKLFLYGPDADKLFKGIEPVLRGYPLCQGARVLLRYGAPGAPEKEVML